MVCSNITDLITLVQQWKSQGNKVVFTNGVFDILHIGHATYLQQAAALGNKLVVGINDDASVRRLNKGPKRPVNPELARAQLIASLRCVDVALVFSEDTPLQLIQSIMPNVLVKGGDYDEEETNEQSKTYIVGSKEVKAAGGSVHALDLVPGYSTTSIIAKMKQ
ncbi:MAG: D-glycero-beta-D-manno-heptose 1-phosphate adenylyltransferase [Flavobacteriales bacterium]